MKLPPRLPSAAFRLLPALAPLCLLLAPAAANAATAVTSSVSAATVYADRAVVTRSAHLENVPAGTNELTFENLPTSLATASLQVTSRGPANAIILDVAARPVRSETTADPGEKAIEDKIKALRDQIGRASCRERVYGLV